MKYAQQVQNSMASVKTQAQNQFSNATFVSNQQPVQAKLVEKPAPVENRYNDIFFAVLFYGHVIGIAAVAFSMGVSELTGANDLSESADFKPAATSSSSSGLSAGEAGSIVGALAISFCLSMLYVKACVALGEQLIHTGTKAMIGLLIIMGIIFMGSGGVVVGVICFIIAAIEACWYRWVYNRIAFAGANLAVACNVIKAYPQVVFCAFFALLMNVVWVILWALAMVGILAPSSMAVVDTSQGTFDSSLCTDVALGFTSSDGAVCSNSDSSGEEEVAGTCCYCESSDGETTWMDVNASCPYTGSTISGGLYFVMLVSLYWGSTVISNVMHCVTAGTVAEWWFKATPAESPVWDSFGRAMTWSFGSICFGSLLVAILKAIRQMLREARNNKNAGLFICLIDCILGCIESLLEYFNRYAYCFVAIYGYDFLKAGKAVFSLFKRLGWTTIINDDLIENALTFGSLGVGIFTALPVYFYTLVDDSVDSTTQFLLVFGCFIVGIVMSSITLNVVSSAVATVFVCFAENPAAIFQTHPSDGNTLGSAWKQFHGEEYTQSGMGQYHV